MTTDLTGQGVGFVRRRAHTALTGGLEALNPGAVLDDKGYVVDPEANLLPGVSRKELEAEFRAGAGNELEGKMRAPCPRRPLA